MHQGVEAILIRGRRRLRMSRVLTREASGLAKSQIFANENLRSSVMFLGLANSVTRSWNDSKILSLFPLSLLSTTFIFLFHTSATVFGR